MGWFTKDKDLATLPPLASEARWGIAKGTNRGAPFLVRYNEGAKEWAGHRGLPIKLGFAMPLKAPNPGGMPSTEENGALFEVEDTIVREVAAVTVGVHALVVTNGVMKELVFYIPEGVDIKTLHEKLQAMVKSHAVQCMALYERDWRSYKAFSP